jgi:hypothetical protein
VLFFNLPESKIRLVPFHYAPPVHAGGTAHFRLPRTDASTILPASENARHPRRHIPACRRLSIRYNLAVFQSGPGMSNDEPLWTPSPERRERANLHRFVRFVREATGNDDIGSYAPLYDFSIRHPEKFWSLVWEFCGIRAGSHQTGVSTHRSSQPTISAS